MSSELHEISGSPEHSREEIVGLLSKTIQVLEGLGIRVRGPFTPEAIVENGSTPLCSAGGDGIRACFDRWDGLIISFTNGFDDSNDPERQKIANALRDAGIPVMGPFLEDKIIQND